jgi:hypothetical protein
MPKRYAVRSIRIPLELYGRVKAVAHPGGRYKSIAQFLEMAVLRLVTFEEEEMERKCQEDKFKRQQTSLDLSGESGSKLIDPEQIREFNEACRGFINRNKGR